MPLIIAVTGHRDLIEEDRQRLGEQVAMIFDELARAYPSSRPFQLLSGLAEGADRLVAHVALKKHAHLIACLPMEAALYEADFQASESRAEFRELLSRATAIKTLPLVEGNTLHNVSEQSRRDLQYEALGKYLVGKCQILIALWDGVETNLRGGTSSIITLQRYGKHGKAGLDPHHPLDFPDTGPVYHLLTPRQKNPAPVGDLARWQVLYHSGFKTTEEARKHYTQVLQRTNAYNKDAADGRVRLKALAAKSAEWLIPKSAREKLPAELQTLIQRYALADTLALSYQRRTRRALRMLIFLFGLGAVLLFELFAHGPDKYQSGFLVAYLSVIALAYAIYLLAKFREIKTRHLDCRALAEGLRLQIFWKLGGLPDAVVDHYFAKQRTELDWVRSAIRQWTEPIVPLSIIPDWSLVGRHWLQAQLAFFTNAAKRNRKWHSTEHVCYWAFLVVVVALGLVRLLAPQLFTHGFLVIVMTMLPVLAGAITAYSIKMAFSEQRKQYERMRDLYEHGLCCFEKAMQKHETERERAVATVLRELGREALTENGDWVLLHRERMVEMFVGG